jgi:hypothetical protein
MTMTPLDRTPLAGDAGRVTGERQERPDPEVPEKARRRTFTAQYNQELLAAGRREGRGPAAGGPLLEPNQRVPVGPGRGALAGLKRPSGARVVAVADQHPECASGIDSGELLRVAIQQYLRPYRGGVAGGFRAGQGQLCCGYSSFTT